MYEDDGIYHLLLKINHKNFAIGFAYLKEAGLHPGQMPLITGLYKKEGVTQKEIADRLGIKPSTINVMIRRLEKENLSSGSRTRKIRGEASCISRNTDGRSMRKFPKLPSKLKIRS